MLSCGIRKTGPLLLRLYNWLASVCGRIDHVVAGVATPNYCGLLLLAFHARKTGVLAVQTLLQGFTQKKSARYDRRRCA